MEWSQLGVLLCPKQLLLQLNFQLVRLVGVHDFDGLKVSDSVISEYPRCSLARIGSSGEMQNERHAILQTRREQKWVRGVYAQGRKQRRAAPQGGGPKDEGKVTGQFFPESV
eukprot:3892604-Amphidinium_carterae.2